jgi:hypothetical protein
MSNKWCVQYAVNVSLSDLTPCPLSKWRGGDYRPLTGYSTK